MSSTTPGLLTAMTDQEHEAFSRRGEAIYETKLRSVLEPDHRNEYVAIHVDSEEYALGKSSGDAMRAMRQRQPDGRLVILHVGPEPEWGLAARLLASRKQFFAKTSFLGSEAAGDITQNLQKRTQSQRSRSRQSDKQYDFCKNELPSHA